MNIKKFLNCFITKVLLLFIALQGISFTLAYAEASFPNGEQGIFGPKQYLRTTGSPNIYEDIFAATPGPGYLVIRNCEADSKHRVTSALIFINGEQIYEPKDFKQDVYILDLPVVLDKINTIRVELRSKPGTYLTIGFGQMPPTVHLTADPSTIILGASTTLSWNSAMADTCVIEPGIGEVSVNGFMTVSPTVTTTYTITAIAPAGSVTSSVTIEVIPPPTIHFTIRPNTIIEGQTASLEWSTTTAETVTIDNGIGQVDVNGTVQVTPAETTTYIITAIGPGGTTTDTKTITVYHIPTVNISADPNPIIEGATTTLTWNSEYAENCTIEPGIGQVESNGTITVSPSKTTTYTITAAGPGGSTQASTIVTVYHIPTVQLTLDRQTIIEGESAILTWSSKHAETCTIEPGIGSVDANGSISVLPIETTKYTITVVGPGGTATAEANLTVYHVPTVTLSINPNAIIEGEVATLSWNTEHADTITIEPGIGQVNSNGTMNVTPEDTTTYVIFASGPGGSTTKSVTITVRDSSAPPKVSFFPEKIMISKGESITLSWTSEKAESAFINHGIGVVPVSGNITVQPENSTTYTLTVTGSTGAASAQSIIQVSVNPEPMPEGTFGAQYQYLIPEDSTVEKYDEYRFAIITGLVEDADGTALPGVSITLQNYPEYGSVISDDEGKFGIPVDGGGVFTIVYQKAGYLNVHRNIEVPWKDIAVAETVQMTGIDPVSTTITFDGNPSTVVTHRSSQISDEFGERSCSMVFSGDNQAYAVDDQGIKIVKLTTIATRATEFTTSKSMPAILPSNSAFTYCAELSVDGVAQVVFNKPVVTWIDNFLGFDVGEIVPSGYYDRNKSEWIASNSGVVVKLLDTNSDGIVDALDSTGNDQPNDLNGDGSFIDEVKGLDDPLKYAPGTTFWRVEVTHFTPWDYNWSFGPPGDSIFPNPLQIASIDTKQAKDCNTPINSYVEDRSRIFHEDIPVPGTDLSLHYASNRVEGYKHEITIPASGASVPGSLKGIIVKLLVAGNQFMQVLSPQPNQFAEFIWDGRDSLGGPVTNAVEGRIQIGFLYDGVYQKTAKFGYNGNGNISGSRTRQEVILWKYDSIIIDALLNNKEANNYFMAEGWTLSNQHYLNQLSAVLYKGDGTLVDNDLDGVFFLPDGDNSDSSIETDGALLVTASGVKADKLTGIGLYASKVAPKTYLINKDFYTYARLFGQNSIPTSILAPIEKYFVNPTSVKCINNTLNVTYSIAKDYHAGGGCYTQNTWSEPTETAHCIYYNNFYWYGSYYDPNYVKDIFNNYYIFNNEHYTPNWPSDFSKWFVEVYQAKTNKIQAYLNYGAACLTSLTYNNENNPSFSYRNCEMQTGKKFTIEKITCGKEITIHEDTGISHIMSYPGRHVKTIDTTTGVTLRAYNYDEKSRIVSIADRFGNKTLILRDIDGIPNAIVSPDGIRTELTIDSNNNLTHIAYGDGASYNFEYSADGLMIVKTDPRGNRFKKTYSNGKITDITDPEGGHWQYNRTHQSNDSIVTEFTTGEGNKTTYIDNTLSTGAFSSTIIDPTGAQTIYNRSADGLSVNKILSCGMSLDFQYTSDSEYGFKYVKNMIETTPSGLGRNTARGKIYNDTNADGLPDYFTETLTVNNKTSKLITDTLQSSILATSSTGRTVTTHYDPATSVTTAIDVPGLFGTTFGYDTSGRITSVLTNTRKTDFSYDSEGNLKTIKDPEGHTTTFGFDAVGRVTAVYKPDTSNLYFNYDKNGNMTVLTNPNNITHNFGFNKVNLASSYQTPLSGNYSYLYDRDRRLIKKTFPSGKQIYNIYDGIQLSRIQTPEGDIDLTYLCSSKVGAISKAGETIDYDYDGKLITSETLGGTLNQSLSYTYNNDFNVKTFTCAGVTEQYTYDNDGLLTGSGNYTISRNAQNGLPESVTGGVLNLARSFNGYGETDGQSVDVNGRGISSWSVNRDNNGRVISKTETAGGITSNYTYEYDSMGRLVAVTKDGTLVEEYQYSLNGSREYEMNSLRGIAGRTLSYSDEDHLLTAGDVSYQYDLDGFLTQKGSSADTTNYGYSSRGELMDVMLPDGKYIEYEHDPLGRRIAKRVNGTIVEKYLWQGLTRLLAMYDGSDNLIQRFEYASDRLPVAMIQAGATYYLSYNQVGSLRLVADSSGNVVKRIEYDSFGNIIEDTNPDFKVLFGFAGGLIDTDTGLVRFGYRDFDPEVGRWTAKDPIFFEAGDTDLYGYVLNDPINLIDPYGLYGFDAFLQDASNFSAGFGDTITFDGTAWIRDQWNQKVWNSEGSVDPCSGAYTAGKWSGYAWEATTIGIGSAPRGWLLGRGKGILNTNDYVRLGWSWKGSAREGKEIIRLAIGSKRLPIHWHFP